MQQIQTQSAQCTDVHESEGIHLLLTLSGCPAGLLDNEALLRDIAVEAATASGATVLAVNSHKFTPQGVTALVLLAESHASLHTYPETGVLFWDCFTCGTSCKPELSIDVLVARLSPKVVNRQLIRRGPHSESQVVC